MLGPKVAHIEVTRKCNFACEFCYNDVQAGRREMSQDEIGRFLREFAGMGGLMVNFSGGEIGLRRDFVQLWRSACELGIRCALETNASHLSDELLAELSGSSQSGV